MVLPEHIEKEINDLLDKIGNRDIDVGVRRGATSELYQKFVYKSLVIPRTKEVLLGVLEEAIARVGQCQIPDWVRTRVQNEKFSGPYILGSKNLQLLVQSEGEVLDGGYFALFSSVLVALTNMGGFSRPDWTLFHYLLDLAEASPYFGVKTEIIAQCFRAGAALGDESVARRVLNMLFEPSMRPVYSEIIEGLRHCNPYEGFVEALTRFARQESDGQLAGKAIELLCKWWRVEDQPPVAEAVEATKQKILAASFDSRRERLLELIQSKGGPENLDLSGQSFNSMDLSRDMIQEELRRFQLKRPDAKPVWVSEKTGGMNLRGSNLSRTQLIGVRLQEADLSECDLKEAILSGEFGGAILRNANLESATVTGDFHRVDMRGANLSNANLHSTEMVSACLVGANLSGTNCSFADFRGADLSHADLSDADFTFTKLEGTNLEAVITTHQTDFSNARLSGTPKEPDYAQWRQEFQQEAQEDQSKIQSFLEQNDPESAFDTLWEMYQTHQDFKYHYKKSWYATALKLFAQVPVSTTLIEFVDTELAVPSEDQYPVALDVFATIASHLSDDKFDNLVNSALLGLNLMIEPPEKFKFDNLYLIDLGYRTVLKVVEKRGMYELGYEICGAWLDFLTKEIERERFAVKSYQTAFKKYGELEAIAAFIKRLEVDTPADQRELVELVAGKQRTALFKFGHKWQSLCDKIAQVLYPSVLLDSRQETMLVDGKRPDIIIDDGSVERDPVNGRITHATLFIDAKLGRSVPSKDIEKYMLYCDRLQIWTLETEPPVLSRYVLDPSVEMTGADDLQDQLTSQGHAEIATEIEALLAERRDLERRVLKQFERELKRHLRRS